MATFRDNLLFLQSCFLKHGVLWSINDIEGYTTQELIYQMCKKINETIEDANETKKLVMALRDFIVGEGLNESVKDRLDEMFDDGTLADIIDTQIFGSLKKELEDMATELEQYKKDVEDNINNSIEELNNKINDKLQKFADAYNVLFEFDLRYIVPSSHGQVMLKKTRVSQSLGINNMTGEMFGARVYDDNHQGLIAKFTENGSKESSIVLLQGGHMTCFGVEPVWNEGTSRWDSYIWCNMDVMQGNKQTGNVLARFKYDDTISELALNDNRVQIIDTGSKLYSIPSIDSVNDLLGLIRKDNGRYWVEVFKLSEIKKGVVNKIGHLDLGQNDTFLQGYAISGDCVYWRVGTADGTLADTLTVYNWKQNKQLYQVNTALLEPVRSQNNETENFREPEGLCVYTNPKTKARSLFICTSIGESGRRKHYVHAYHQTGNGGMFADRLNGRGQQIEITKPDGQVLDVPLKYKKLSEVTKLGHYYMTGDEYVRFSDRPDKNTSDGWFLFVTGHKASWSIDSVQIMVRSSSPHTDIYIRLNRGDGATPWKLVHGTKSIRIDGQTKLRDLNMTTSYYLTTADFDRMTDRPKGSPSAGYFLENSHKDPSGSFMQTLRRNSSNEPTTYTRLVNSEGGASPWYKLNLTKVE